MGTFTKTKIDIPMDFVNFLQEMLGITQDYGITQIEKFESEKIIKIHLKYLLKRYKKEWKEYPFYDTTPEREWQHLIWFNYKCYLELTVLFYFGKLKLLPQKI